MGTIVFEAPDDVFVQEIAANEQVAKGDKLIVFRSPGLDRLHASLESLLEHIAIIERPLKDGRVDEEIKTLNQKAPILKEASEAADAALVVVKNFPPHDPGAPPGDLDGLRALRDAQITAAQAQCAYLDAELSASHAERKKLDLLDKIASAKNKLAREQDYLSAMAAGLTILSPNAGQFTGHVSPGAFLKKGQVAGEVLQ
jgi:hypothetical protein